MLCRVHSCIQKYKPKLLYTQKAKSFLCFSFFTTIPLVWHLTGVVRAMTIIHDSCQLQFCNSHSLYRHEFGLLEDTGPPELKQLTF